MKKKVAFKTLGCRLNQFETNAVYTDFYKAGYEIVNFNDEADVYVVNTCTVTNQSDQKSKNYINQAIKKTKGSLVVVTGCMANNQKEQLESRDEITYVIENKNKSSIYPLVEAHFNGELVHPSEFKQDLFNFAVAEKGFHTRSMIKIHDGCNNFCSFCIVPKVRGKATSRPVNDIIENIKKVLDIGYKEIVLTGVNISRYSYENYNFEDLVSMILQLEGDFRVRISSIEPEGFGERFIELFEDPKLCPHLHLCLQSGSDRTLIQMRRQYNIQQFKNLLASFKIRYPDFNFTTDVIVGFPGETEEDFRKSCEVSKELGFSHIHTFKYSVRKGTRAERLPDQIPEKIKKERSDIIRGIAEENKINYRKTFIGKTQKMLVEKIYKGIAKGYGEHYLPIEVSNTNLSRNMYADVRINAIREQDGVLLGKISEEL